MPDWVLVDAAYPAANERVLIATDDGNVGLGFWEPDSGWLMFEEEEIGDVEPLYWAKLPTHPDRR